VTAETTWLLLRSTGLVALAALTLSVATGLAGPAITRPAWRAVSVSVHRSGAVVGLGLTMAHVVLAVLDPYVAIDAAAAVVPGTSGWEPVWVSAGALALDALVVVALSSALRGRGPRTWWTLHALTYPAWILATGHALAVGTDTWRAPYLVAGVAGVLLVVAAVAARTWASGRGRPAGPAVPADPAASSTGVGMLVRSEA
jgi:DMSO/TMAO reductase YedYZ heme-binding membrane subunit